MARKGQATSELPEWLSAFVSATQSQIEASRAQAERSERNFTALLAKLDQQEERHKDTTAALQQQLAQATNATPASGPPNAPPSRPPSAPPPAKLTPDLSLREFRAWRATWTDFFELSDGQRLSPDRQLALFRTCLSSEMRAALGHTIPTKTTLNEQLDEIAEHFRRQRNVALYRVQFEQRQQQTGESFDNFYVAIRELATDAELCGTCLETRLTTRIMSGVRSEEVRKKLLALTPFPQLEAVVALCRSEESACNTEADLSSKPALNAAVRSPALCRYCGGRPHRSRSDCPAYGKTCSLCNRRHHFPQVCESRDKPLPTRTGQPQQRDMHAQQPKQTRSISIQRTRTSPQVFVQLYTKDGERSLGSHAATPDTGAEATVIGRRQFLALGLSLADLQPPLHDEVVVANGETLPCLGTYPLQIRLGQRSTVARAAVFDSVDGILLAWFVVRDLGLIPHNFPEPLPLYVDRVAAPPSSSSSPPDWDWLWRPGKTHAIPGALSRAPVDNPTPADQVGERDVELHVRRVVTAVSADLAESLPPLTPATHCKGTSPVDPLLTSQQKEPFAADPLPRRVFEVASADFFSHAGQTYLVYSDRLSGWMEIAQLPSTAARPSIRTLAAWFCRLGIPTMLRTDGGPPFNSHDFRMFLDRWSVTHAPSSPHCPQSNGHAEANVKKVKLLLRKSAPEGDITSTAFQQGLLELRNMPDASGRSPAQIVFGHSLRSTVPAHHTSFATEWSTASDQIDQRAADLRDAAISTYNRSSKPLGPLQLGATIRVQDPQTKLWDKIATVISIGQHRTYRVRLASGRVLWRNRRFLRVVPSAPTSSPAENQPSSDTSDHAPRRSTRTRNAPTRLTM